MEFICELIFEIILEGIFGVTVKNPKLKTWIKTAFFLLIAEGVAGLLIWLSVRTYLNGNVSGGIGSGTVSVLLAVGFAIAAVYGHKRDWKQNND